MRMDEKWREWLTDDRLSRWNHIRYRAGVDAITAEDALNVLTALERSAESGDRGNREELDLILDLLR